MKDSEESCKEVELALARCEGYKAGLKDARIMQESLRDKLAMCALSACIQESASVHDAVEFAYKYADAMLEEREKER